MYGELARLGLIVPSTNTTAEPELDRLMPRGVDCFATRVLQVETEDPAKKVETVLAMRGQLDDAVLVLRTIGLRAIGFACTAASFLDGARDDRETCARLTDLAGVPFVTASRAVVTALRAIEVERIMMVTPYLESINEIESSFLAEEGFDVIASEGLGIVGNLPKGRLPATASADAVMKAWKSAPRPEAVFISCTNWRTVDVLEELSERFEVPVISSNTALAWALCRSAGVEASLQSVPQARHEPSAGAIV